MAARELNDGGGTARRDRTRQRRTRRPHERSRLGLNPGAPEGPLVPAIAAVSERDYPFIHASRTELVSGTGDERFCWSIDVLVNGILQTPRGIARPTPLFQSSAGPQTPGPVAVSVAENARVSARGHDSSSSLTGLLASLQIVRERADCTNLLTEGEIQ